MRFHWAIGIAIVALGGASTLVQAAPPTVTPSPGYDRALQESRAPTSGTATTIAPVMPGNPPVTTHRHTRKKHTN